jgi:sugar phosphate isomerase/epimerase
MISLGHPTLIDLSPPELVRVAARAGFDAVNFRITQLDAKDGALSLLADEASVRETAAALAETGIALLDTEVIRIEPDTRADDFRPLFEVSRLLGARYVVAVGMAGDEAVVAGRFAELCAAAYPYGLKIVLEFMARGSIRTLDQARRIVTPVGAARAGILIDALHFYRSGAVVSDLAAIDPAFFPYMQINDVEDFRTRFSSPTPESVVWKKVLPGSGDLELAALMAALPPGIPVSVEVPPAPGTVGAAAEQYAARALESTRAVLAKVPA